MSLFDSLSGAGQVVLPVAGGIVGGYFGGPTGAMAGATAGTAMSNMWLNNQNYHAQQEQYRYQKGLQRDIFAREDSSIQRRTRDMIAAGLSPTLAAGSGAGAGTPVSVKVGQREMNSDAVMTVLSMIKMKEDVSNTVAQRKLIQAQADRSIAEAGIKWHDLKIYKKSGMPSNSGNVSRELRDLFNLGSSPNAQGVINEMNDKLNIQKFKENMQKVKGMSPDEVERRVKLEIQKRFK